MAIDTTTPRTRRMILAGAFGGLAAWIASALGRTDMVRANEGDPVLAGHLYSATQVTGFDTTGAPFVGAFSAFAGSAYGVYGSSQSNYGVEGSSLSSVGVVGVNESATSAAVLGESVGGGDGTGVYGYSGVLESQPATPPKTGVYGFAAQDATAVGVYGQSGLGTGVHGVSDSAVGVVGRSTSSYGVSGVSISSGGVGGTSTSGTGVVGSSTSGIAVRGGTYSTTMPAISGYAWGNTIGVLGYSGAGSAPSVPAKTGVYGYAAQDATSRGVTGQTVAGYGVSGIATTGHGVNGTATTGIGVIGYGTTGYGTYGYATTTGIGARGYSISGTGGYFSTSGPKVGVALRAIGKVKLDNCAGVATIAAGTNSVVVTPGIDLTGASAVVATLQGNPTGTVMVRSVAVNATADTFTIYLTANATTAVTVAWHVFG